MNTRRRTCGAPTEHAETIDHSASIPDAGQVSEYAVNPSIKQCCNVFHDDELRSYDANEARKGRPETGSFSVNSSASTSMADVLAWESAAYDIDSADPADIVAVDSLDIFKARDAWPVPPEDCAAIGVAFTECNGSHPSSLESKAESADAAE